MIKFIDILNAARKIVAARQRWNQQDGPNIQWGGGMTKQVSEDLDMTIRTACDSTADEGDEIEAKARGLQLSIDDVAYSHQKWLQDASMGLPTAPPRGSDQLHRVIDRLEEQLKSSDLPSPPPIAQLIAQKVSPNQIAIIYGWKTVDGSPDAQKVFEEMEKPGTHYKESKWVHPANKAIERETEQRWAARSPRSRLFGLQANGVSIGDEESAKPQIPSLDQLLEVKAPVEQIMRLHSMTEEEVLEAAAIQGVDLKVREIKPANATVAHHERMAEK